MGNTCDCHKIEKQLLEVQLFHTQGTKHQQPVNDFDEFTDITGTPSKQLESYKSSLRQSNYNYRKDPQKHAGFDRLEKKNEFMKLLRQRELEAKAKDSNTFKEDEKYYEDTANTVTS